MQRKARPVPCAAILQVCKWITCHCQTLLKQKIIIVPPFQISSIFSLSDHFHCSPWILHNVSIAYIKERCPNWKSPGILLMLTKEAVWYCALWFIWLMLLFGFFVGHCHYHTAGSLLLHVPQVLIYRTTIYLKSFTCWIHTVSDSCLKTVSVPIQNQTDINIIIHSNPVLSNRIPESLMALRCLLHNRNNITWLLFNAFIPRSQRTSLG